MQNTLTLLKPAYVTETFELSPENYRGNALLKNDVPFELKHVKQVVQLTTIQKRVANTQNAGMDGSTSIELERNNNINNVFYIENARKKHGIIFDVRIRDLGPESPISNKHKRAESVSARDNMFGKDMIRGDVFTKWACDTADEH